MSGDANERTQLPQDVSGRKRLAPPEIAELAKRIANGDERCSFNLMRRACEAGNWTLLESCSSEHVRLAPESSRPYLYLAIAQAHLDRQTESEETLPRGYERCASASAFMNEMAFVLGVLGHDDDSLHYFVLGKFLAAGRGDQRKKLARLGKAFHAFQTENRLGAAHRS